MTARARRATGLIKLSTDSAKPLSHQLADTLRRLIIEGIWIKDDKLPGSRTIAADAHVSRNTVNAALEILTSEGMLESRGRSGLFVIWKHAPREQRNIADAKPEMRAHQPLALDAMPLELFPLDVWKRLKSRYWSRASTTSLAPDSPLGARPLRDAIAVLVNITAGISCNVDQVIVVSGLRDALALSKAALGQENLAAWIEDPAHKCTRAAVRAAGIGAVSVPVDSQGLSVDTAASIGADAKMAIVRPVFQFPTGVSLSQARAQDLLDWSSAKGLLVIEDATESEFSFSKRAVRSLTAMETGTVAHFNTFAGTMFPSLGLGYLVVPNKLVEAFHRSRNELRESAPAAMQIVLAEFINAGHFAKHVRKLREIAEQRQSALLAALARVSSLPAPERQLGGLHVCARLNAGDSDTLIGDRAAAAGIDVAPLSAMYARRPASQGMVMGFAAFDPQEISQAVDTLARLLPHATSPEFGTSY